LFRVAEGKLNGTHELRNERSSRWVGCEAQIARQGRHYAEDRDLEAG
jgi:hypothetical protein